MAFIRSLLCSFLLVVVFLVKVIFVVFGNHSQLLATVDEYNIIVKPIIIFNIKIMDLPDS